MQYSPEDYIAAVIEKLSNMFVSVDIKLQAESSEEEENRRTTWEREEDWRIVSVELVQKRVLPDMFSVAFTVYLKGTNIPKRVFDGFMLKTPGKHTDYFQTPGRLRALLETPERFADAIVERVSAKLHWFDQLASPKECLRNLRSGNTIGAGEGGEAFDIIEDRLNDLAQAHGKH